MNGKSRDRRNTEGAGRDTEMERLQRDHNTEGSNFGEVDPGVEGIDASQSPGATAQRNPDTDATGTFTEPSAGRDLGIEDIERGEPTSPDLHRQRERGSR